MENTEKMSGIFAEAEFNRFGIISMVILIIGCLGGIAVGLGAIEYVWALTLIVVPTMTTLSLLLAVAPMKYILTGAVITTAIDLIFISYFLLT